MLQFPLCSHHAYPLTSVAPLSETSMTINRYHRQRAVMLPPPQSVFPCNLRRQNHPQPTSSRPPPCPRTQSAPAEHARAENRSQCDTCFGCGGTPCHNNRLQYVTSIRTTQPYKSLSPPRGCHITWCWHGSGCCLPDAASHKYSIRQALVSQAAA